MSNNKKTVELLRKLILSLFIVMLIAVEITYRMADETSFAAEYLYLSATRFIGGAVCIMFIFEFSFSKIMHVFGNKKPLALLLVLPAFVVAVNNFPFVSFFSGDCGIAAKPEDVLIYALFCLSVGFFEEMAFRGCALMYLLKKRTDSRLGIFMAIFWSSVLFGAVHLINLTTSSPGAVFLQLGYSALIGALCSVVLLETGNIWLCVLLHSVYNFVGNVIPELGYGTMWTLLQMTFTAIIAVIVTAYTIWRFFTMPISRATALYKNNSEKI